MSKLNVQLEQNKMTLPFIGEKKQIFRKATFPASLRGAFLMRVAFLALLLLTLVSPCLATVLTFDGIANVSDETIPDDYGDRVTATTDGNGYVYGVGVGFTPNVIVEYARESSLPFSLWTSGYGDLVNALGHDSFGVSGEIRLRPDPGFSVILNSFDVGAWNFDRQGNIRVQDGDGTLLYDSGLITIPGPSSGHWSYSESPIFSTTPLSIFFQDEPINNNAGLWGDLGLDNVSFSQRAIPEPSTLLLSTLAIAGLLTSRRRRNK